MPTWSSRSLPTIADDTLLAQIAVKGRLSVTVGWPGPLGPGRSWSAVVAAVRGAVAGGLGLALSADFRVTGPGTRFWPNFGQLEFHHGFWMTVTPIAVVCQQTTLELPDGA